MATRPSVSEILKAARSGSPASASAPSSASENDAPATVPAAEKKVPKAKPVSAESSSKPPPPPPRPSSGGMTVKEKLAAARAGGSKPAEPVVSTPEAANKPKPVAAKPKEAEESKPPEPVGRPVPILGILIAGWVGFVAIVALVYVLFGPTLAQLVAKPPERAVSAPGSVESRP